MSDEPDQEEERDVSEEDWRSRPLIHRERSVRKEPDLPVKTPEELLSEQQKIQSVLRASQLSGADPSTLTEHLGKVVERLSKEGTEEPDSTP